MTQDELDELIRDSLSPAPLSPTPTPNRLLADLNENIDWPDFDDNIPIGSKKPNGKRTFEYSDDEDEDDTAGRHSKRARGSESSETLNAYEDFEDAAGAISAIGALVGVRPQDLDGDDLNSGARPHREQRLYRFWSPAL